MVQYRDLNAPPPRMLAEIVADMNNRDRQSKTGDAGVKDLGESGDVVWPRTDGEVASIRDVDLELADARQRIEDAEGDLAGAQARIDTALDAEGHIREDEILRNATLLGDTVVEQINVTDKLVGTDGVFTGTVDFANVNVTGELLANEISGEHIYGTVVEGGEVRTGTDESRGAFLLGDEAFVNPDDGYVAPGLRFTPPNSTHAHQPALGVFGSGVRISGGKSAAGSFSTLSAAPGSVVMRTTAPEGGTERVESIYTGQGVIMQSRLKSGAESATINTALSYDYSGGTVPARALIQVEDGGFLSTIGVQGDGTARIEAGGATPRSLRVDTSGVWVTTNKSGVTESWNLEETANDTGWINFNAHTGISTGNSPALRLKGGIVWAQGYVTRPAGWPSGWTRIAGSFATWLRPTRDILRYGATTATQRQLVRMTSTGYLEVWWSAAAPGEYQVDLSVLSYPNS